jgi:hypothetical protein
MISKVNEWKGRILGSRQTRRAPGESTVLTMIKPTIEAFAGPLPLWWAPFVENEELYTS